MERHENHYLEAAKIAESNLRDYGRAFACYLKSGECYRGTLSDQAYFSFRKFIDACVQDGSIRIAINQSARCGYIYQKEFRHGRRSEEFYDLADYLRSQNLIEHTCQFPSVYMNAFVQEISNGLNGNVQVSFKISRSSQIYCSFNRTSEANPEICRKCVHFCEILSQFINGGLSLDKKCIIDWVKENYQRLKDEVWQAVAHLEESTLTCTNFAPKKRTHSSSLVDMDRLITKL
ncbi:hypothetical protein RF11_13453 [Thelohanellus kitauei]|uniref:Alpha-soluble NSF attachment protein n=1 Tax=Thelohanellus kitauei TaxID=669202 RepID=A0A0C2IU86_THEKT|nr:hypothetical protein RF11_13453 [Thelohanellus kitauei]